MYTQQLLLCPQAPREPAAGTTGTEYAHLKDSSKRNPTPALKNPRSIFKILAKLRFLPYSLGKIIFSSHLNLVFLLLRVANCNLHDITNCKTSQMAQNDGLPPTFIVIF